MSSIARLVLGALLAGACALFAVSGLRCAPDLDGPRVYFIRYGDDGPVKIGYSGNVRRRVDELQTGAPEELHILATAPGSRTDERALHRRFRDHHARGEWYRAEPPVLACAEETRRTGALCR